VENEPTVALQKSLMLDLLFNSEDSHIGQVIKSGNNLINIDFARFGSPHVLQSEGVKQGGIAGFFSNIFGSSSKGEHYGILRSFALDTPAADAEVDVSIKNEILHLNVGDLEKNWRAQGLIISDKEIENRAKEIDTIYADNKQLSSIKSTQLAKLKSMGAKYGVSFKEGTSFEDFKKQISRAMITKEQEIKSQVWGKFSETSLAQLKQRVTAMKEYFQEDGVHTMKEVFFRTQPELAPFYKAREYQVRSPGNSIWLDGQVTISLEEILRRFIKSDCPPTLSQDQKKSLIGDMEKALKNINKQNLAVPTKVGRLMSPGCLLPF
jgi:hypothetical protein